MIVTTTYEKKTCTVFRFLFLLFGTFFCKYEPSIFPSFLFKKTVSVSVFFP